MHGIKNKNLFNVFFYAARVTPVMGNQHKLRQCAETGYPSPLRIPLFTTLVASTEAKRMTWLTVLAVSLRQSSTH